MELKIKSLVDCRSERSKTSRVCEEQHNQFDLTQHNPTDLVGSTEQAAIAYVPA